MRKIKLGESGMLLGCLIAIGSGAGATQSAQDSVTLQGILVRAEFFGPPNYGEHPRTDARRHVLVLQLPAPASYQVATRGNHLRDSLLALAATFVQLQPGPGSATVDSFVGRRVEVRGLLVGASLGAEYTPVVLRSASIHPIADWKW